MGWRLRRGGTPLPVWGLGALLVGGALAALAGLADPGGGPPAPVIGPDVASDTVAATAAAFRVDASGAATYSVALYAVPGTAGVSPRLSLAYSSQGGAGPLGKGWSIAGLSAISRCRMTREAGDFIVDGQPVDGRPAPVNFSATDRYCLDGQRLIPAQANGAACPAIGGMAVRNLRTEIESFQRVCAYTPDGGSGVAFFTVDRQDGSRGWYGDRDQAGAANRPDGYFNSTAPGKEAFALSWAQTRFEDSTGNYIDFHYLKNPAGAGLGEHLIHEVRYTGKRVLAGQGGAAQAPYAKLRFNYSARPAEQWGQGYASGGLLAQTRRLDSIVSCASGGAGDCALDAQARFYPLSYGPSDSGSPLENLKQLQECRDSTRAVCLPATRFTWSTARYGLSTYEGLPDLPTGSGRKFEGFKMGDVDGDGIQDIVYLKDGSRGDTCPTEHIIVLYGTLGAGGTLSYQDSSPICTPAELMSARGHGSWKLLDYDGDGRDDLLVSDVQGQPWRVYRSQGRAGNANFIPTNVIAGLTPAIPSYDGPSDQLQLADLNGDGLSDVVYPRDGGLKARLMERGPQGFGWGAERMVDVGRLSALNDPVCLDPNTQCFGGMISTPVTQTGFVQKADFNGDSASDLMMGTRIDVRRYRQGMPGCNVLPLSPGRAPRPLGGSAGTGVTWLGYLSEAARAAASGARSPQALDRDCVERFIIDTLHAMVVSDIQPDKITLAPYADLRVTGGLTQIEYVDFNGDGLTDLAYRQAGAWHARLNTGAGLLPATPLPAQGNLDKLRFADLNGDGRTDLLHTVGGTRYHVSPALPAGGFGTPYALQAGEVVGENDLPIFADVDGDGHLDYLRLSLGGSRGIPVALYRASARHAPRDVITRFTNGFGAETDLHYASLTQQAVYRRASHSRNTLDWGRGSAVHDLFVPSYVVARASSSAPQAGAPEAKATVHYRYANARMQAGGRGFLGFEEIVTIDPNPSGGYVTTQTRYAQSFPFVGVPLSTVKRAVSGGTYAVPDCLNGRIDQRCFLAAGTPFAAPAGEWFSSNDQGWEADGEMAGPAVQPFAAGIQAPLHVRTLSSHERLRDPFTGEITRAVLTAFTYGAHGHTLSTQVDTMTGEGVLQQRVSTHNTYADDPGRWRLGRLTQSTVRQQRYMPDRPAIVRTSRFAYDMGAAATGQLLEERAMAGAGADQELVKRYTLDAYGNRLRSSTCSTDITACDGVGVAFQPDNPQSIHRTGRVAYDAQGRYPVTTYESFWSGAGTVEKPTQQVVSRNLFGEVTHAYDAHGRDSLAVPGTFGRTYYTWQETVPGSAPGDPAGGVSSTTRYRWCGPGGVDCPAGARFREQVRGDGAPGQWTYFDRLGRPVLKATESFNAGVPGQDVSAVCTTYAANGQPVGVSHPFFLPGVAGGDGPNGLAGVCTAPARQWTTTTYDLLGRVVRVETPDVGATTTTTTRYQGRVTFGTDPRGNLTRQTRNAMGELVETEDANGLTTRYTYHADGAPYGVTRNAGRGEIQNTFHYDTAGRKTRQEDPDSGVTTFAYNALGELIAQQDAEGYRGERWYDARGRVWRARSLRPDGAVETQAAYGFDTGAHALGQPVSETISGGYAAWAGQTGLGVAFERHYQYDPLGRPQASRTRIDGADYPAQTRYDRFGRPWKVQDASGRWAKTQYGLRGHPAAVCESGEADTAAACPADGSTYTRTLSTDARGQVLHERRGNQTRLEVKRSYWAETGRLSTLCAGESDCQLVSEHYGWDGLGNLTTQRKERRYTETFEYDRLNRLVRGTRVMANGVQVNQETQRYEYDQLGNLCRKVGGGEALTYQYGGPAGCGLGGANSGAGGVGAGGSPGGGVTLPPGEEDPLRPWIPGRPRPGPPDPDEPGWRDFLLDPNKPPPPLPPDFVPPSPPVVTRPAIAPSNARGAHQVSVVNGVTYQYDRRGNQTDKTTGRAEDSRRVRYNAANQAYEARTGNGQTTRFWYGSDGQRYKREDGARRTLYLGNVEIVTEGGRVTLKRIVAGVALQLIVGQQASTYYQFHDRLGSLIRLTDAAGTVLGQMDFQGFGGRRHPDTLRDDRAPNTRLSTRGYTGHEMIDGALGLIHMNARMFDPQLGRFLQVDPVVQAPENAQSWNAYTYVFNNPYAYTDPTGMIGVKERQWLAVIFTVVAAIFFPAAAPTIAKFGYAVAAGAIAGGIATGSWQGAAYGAFSAALFYGIGSYFEYARWAQATETSNAFGSGLSWGGYGAKTLAHGVAGGVMSQLQGGKFGDGFASAGVVQAFSPAIDRIPGNGASGSAARVAAAALVGGTASAASGGKFANGAATAAFSRAFNDEVHTRNKNTVTEIPGPGSIFRTRKMAVESADNYLTDISGGRLKEFLFGSGYVASVFEVEGGYSYVAVPTLTGTPPVSLRGLGGAGVVFKSSHYASRLQAAGLDVVRTEMVVAREVARISRDMQAGANVVGRIRVNGVAVEYRMKVLNNGTVNVGTIFPVR
ncbi:hypothetical protein EBB59_12165 [Lysobacter pythonis]|uniref:Uncharacterized protein n=1 Tax=Solilutibacter pythonis TaxID=2483112 RepID=A0A3M2HEJ3_9GAMM|nr:FG-GAP-like repeat-containing protein [Lysobacter pythonis]RMH88121.1 hypothetical protein EBB59_12165 [Lysobacter pythonis]